MSISGVIPLFCGLASFFLIAFGLYIGKELLIPFVIAIVIWYLLISVASLFQNLPSKKLKFPYPVALFFALLVTFLLLFFIFDLVTVNTAEVLRALPLYQEKLERIFNSALKLLPVDLPTLKKDIFGHFSLVSIATSVVQTITGLVGYLGIIFLYVLFLILEWRLFDLKLAALFPDEKQLAKAKKIIKTISKDIQYYILIKTALSLAVALLSYALFKIVGVHFAAFWALIIFLLNYIPTIGSIIATILPCLLTLIQFDSWIPFIFVTTALITMQFLQGNIIEPRIVGRSINLSPIIILISLAVWGYLWGVIGLFLGVPLMVIVNIIFSHFETTRPIAILLSERGQIYPTTD